MMADRLRRPVVTAYNSATSPDVRDALRDPQGMSEIEGIIAAGDEAGTRSLRQHISELVSTGAITAETARAAVADPDSLILPEAKGKKKVKS